MALTTGAPPVALEVSSRVARLLTEIAAPWVWCVALPYAVAFSSDIDFWPAVGWGTLVAFGAAAVPMGVIMRGIRRGSVQSGHHITTRTERYVPLLAALTSVTAVLSILAAADGPPTIVAVTVVMLATVVVALAITRVWKVSMHAAVAAGSVVVLGFLHGPPAALLWIPVAAVCWSRVKLRDHTTAQVIAGTAVGICTSLLFDLIA